MEVVKYDLNRLIAVLQIPETEIIDLLLVGSRLHGTASPASDYDFILIVKDGTHLPEGNKVEREDLDVTIFTRSEYLAKLNAGDDWQTIEPLWLPSACRWIFKEDFLPRYNSDMSKLRVAVSSIANKGHAYAKILMTKENNFNLGKKNLAHEIRNLRLGIQIVKFGSITDYTESKEIYEQIMAETETDWEFYNLRWGSVAMAHQKEFISITPKKIKEPKPPKVKVKKVYQGPTERKEPETSQASVNGSTASPSSETL